MRLIEALYESNPSGMVKVVKFIDSKIDWYKKDGVVFCYPFEYTSDEPLMRQQKYLATAITSAFVDYVYKSA